MSQLRNRNIVVFGISADTVSTHRAFAASEQLNFALLSDTKKQIITAYDALRPGGSLLRVTYIIGPDGAIRAIDRNVNMQFARRGETLVTRHGENITLLLSDWKAHPGALVPNFFLRNIDGRTVTPKIGERKASVIVLLSVRDARSRAAAAGLSALQRNPVYKDVAFLGIDPHTNETEADIKTALSTNAIPFPITQDPHKEILGHLEATQTPTAWVLDGKGRVIYRGAILSEEGGAVNYVRAALDAALMGRRVPIMETPVRGLTVNPQSAAALPKTN